MIKKVMEDYKVLLRSIPAATVSLFFVSVIMMNLLANKELISLPYLALDCGFVVSWVSFLCQDMICKRFGAKASIKISILALLVNLAVSLCFWACSLTPGMWGAYYDTSMIEVNTALNATIGGTWYVVLGSSLAMLVSAVVNSTLNQSLGRMLKKNNFASFARTCRSTCAPSRMCPCTCPSRRSPTWAPTANVPSRSVARSTCPRAALCA